jgi:hypothetical protein
MLLIVYGNDIICLRKIGFAIAANPQIVEEPPVFEIRKARNRGY